MTRAVLRKELATIWSSPLPYVVGVLFHVAVTVLFVNQLEGRRQAVVQPLFPIAGFLLIALVPVLTMRAFSEERRAGQLDVLLSIPVRARTLVAGKVLAVWSTAAAVVAPSALLIAVVAMWGDPDWGPVVTGYAGLALLAWTSTAIGVLASSLTSLPPVAAVVAFFVNLLLWFSYAAPGADGGGVLARVSFSERLRSFASGALDTADGGYFVAVAVASMIVTSLVVARVRVVTAVKCAAVAVIAIGAIGVLDVNRREADLTADRSLSLTDVSREVADAVRGDVRVTAVLTRNEPGRAEAAALLARYHRVNPRISGRVIDPGDAPGETRRLGVDPVLGGVAVERGDRVERGPTASEQDITSSMARVLREEPPSTCFTTGHGERSITDTAGTGLSQLAALLADNGYAVRALDLGQTFESCDLVVMAAPLDPLGDPGASALPAWLDAGGRALVFVDPESSVDLNAALTPAGLRHERGIIVERSDRGHVPGDPVTPIVAAYRSGFPFVRKVAPTFYPGAQAVAVASQPGEGLAAAVVASTTDSGFLDRDGDLSFGSGDVDGPVGLIAASDRSRVEDDEVVRSRVVVAGDVDFASNAFVAELGNSRLLTQAFDWLTLQEDLVSVSANLPRARPLMLTSARMTYARVLGAVIVPLAFLLAGAAVWVLRRGR